MPWWESSLFWGVVGIVVGFLISTIYYLIGKERISMKHHITSKLIITKETLVAAGVNLVFDNQTINQLIETTVKFTNSGNRTIEPLHYATKEPLGIYVVGHFFRYNVWADNKNSIPNIKLIGDDKYKIEFDFLKPKQTFSIKLFHDGTVDVFGELRSGSSWGLKLNLNLPMYFRMERRCVSPLLRVIEFCALGASGVVIYFVLTFEPLLFAVIGIILGVIIANLLFSIIKFVKRLK